MLARIWLVFVLQDFYFVVRDGNIYIYICKVFYKKVVSLEVWLFAKIDIFFLKNTQI